MKVGMSMKSSLLLAALRLALFSTLLANAWSQTVKAEEVYIISPERYFLADGDNSAWAASDFDHSQWFKQTSRRIDVPPPGIRWVRAPINIPASYIEANQPLSIIVGAMASNELYFKAQFPNCMR